MSLEQNALEFIERMQTLYFERRDHENVLAMMTEDTSWIGTGENEMCRGLQEARQAFAREKQEYPGSFVISGSNYTAVPLNESDCLVYGELRARAGSRNMADLHHRVSALCRNTPKGMKLIHLHLSDPNLDQEPNRFFVSKNNLTDRRNMKQRMEQTALELKARNEELEELTENTPGGVHRCRNDAHLTLLSMSESFLSILGYTRQEVKENFNDRFLDLIYPADREEVIKSLKRQLSMGNTVEMEYRVICKNGKVRWVLDRGKLVKSYDGTQTFYCMMIDITQRRQEQEALRLSLERHQVIMNQATDIIFEWDIRKDTLDFSSNWQKKFGYQPIKSRISRKIPSSANIHDADVQAFVKIMQDTAAGVPYSEAEFRIKNISGIYRWCRIRATTQYDEEGKPLKAVGVIADIDQEKKNTMKLLERSLKDSLTGLLNKKAAEEWILRCIREHRVGTAHAFMILDLDNFKHINDQYGHYYGDRVLCEVSDQLRKLFRSSDVLGRIGGDEFLVFMEDIDSRQTAADKAEAILFHISQIHRLERVPAPVTCSIGIALYPEDALSYDGLYQCADHALYEAKNQGKGKYSFWADGKEENP
ncbi:diguanylate cyclase domain-containing protein [Diplocloster agilis]|uniref:diguanylate cyclase domain-containing protein n=1 Tax=Diplocloster agilis TaxID=2850323 RepID=UPI000822AF11|nr:diguanylate cyclase [Suonthocola fibrivorans]MCU6732890.1 diguanylate cyclase [Suonthocola fibrivorans]SCI66136.1 Cyclic di-GMP phosphodiesterase Gmr [uncultured Clostridium sp.]